MRLDVTDCSVLVVVCIWLTCLIESDNAVVISFEINELLYSAK